MHRIDTVTAQKDKFGAGKNGFTRGNPQTGTPATDLDDDYFDMLQEELCAVVEESGEELDKEKHNQLLTALRALLLSRSNPFGDIASDGPAAIATALSNLGLGNVVKLTDFSHSLGSGHLPQGWRLTPDGFIEQYIVVNVNGNGVVPSNVNINFPIPFPNQLVSIRQAIPMTSDPSARFSGIRSDTISKTGMGLSFVTQTNNNFYLSVIGK